MQSEIANMTVEHLMEVLSYHTQKLTLLLAEKKLYTLEYDECKRAIHEITNEIDNRKQASITNYYHMQSQQGQIKN